MKKLFEAAEILSLCAICGAQSAKHNEPKVITELRAKAAKRGLAFEVRCGIVVDGYVAFAHPPGEHWTGYVEDGAKPYWYARGSTRELAAAELLEALNQPPNSEPDHRPELRRDTKGKRCQSPASGGPGERTQYADERCPDCGKN
jgi:hypothetical protein